MGLGSLKEQKENFKRVFVNKTGKIFTDEVKQRLEHGKKHEIDAMASFVGKVMPVYLPNSNYKETGSYVVLKDEVAKQLADDVTAFIKENVTFLCEVPSLQAIPCADNQDRSEPRTLEDVHHTHDSDSRDSERQLTLLEIEETLKSCIEYIREAHDMTKTRATDKYIKY